MGGDDRSEMMSLVYGVRMVPARELDRVEDARWWTPDGEEHRVTMHLIEGDVETIRRRLHESIDAFFEIFGDSESGAGDAS